ncbi:MAG: glycosyltransferase [Nitrospirae bacterium]|nr:glycosyltransferase [Nitrospirota bacterium]
MDNNTGDYYRQERKEVEKLIPDDAMKVLDVGCGGGVLCRRLLERGAKEVVGIEINPDVCTEARNNLSNVICGDIEEIELDFEQGYFDCIVLADILEHLKYPLLALKKLEKYLSGSGCIVASIPNVRYWRIMDMLIEGNWTYGEYGILDKTHLKFFTKKEMAKLFDEAGFKITEIRGCADRTGDEKHLIDAGFEITYPAPNIDRRSFTITANNAGFSGEIAIGRALLKGLKKEEIIDLFVVQYLIRAEKSERLSRKARISSERSRLKKVAIVRGANLNKWEMQNYEPLLDSFDITAYTTTQSSFDISQIKLPVVKLPFHSQGLLLHMDGLEEQLAGKDLVYSADITYQFSAQAVQAKHKYGCKVICLEWENIPFNFEEHEVARNIKEAVRKGADHFIAVTERAKEALMLEGVVEDKIDVIPMGIDLNTFNPRKEDIIRDRERIALAKEELVVLFIGRMVWEKGVYDFVHAAAKVLNDKSLKGLPLKFLMVGKGPELNGVRESAMKSGISNRFAFIEEYPYQEMYRLHNLADIFVLPSISTKTWQEQFGMVLIESMACGKPVVSTLSGSIPEVVGDAGILVQPNDHISLYEAMRKLITDKDLRRYLGGKALKRAEDEFDSQKTAEKVRAVFEKVMSREPAYNALRDEYDKATEWWREGRREEGFRMVCGTFKKDPDRKDILRSIVQMGSELERYGEVEQCIREYLVYHPADIDSLVTLAETLFHMKEKDHAEEELRKVLLFDPENKEAAVLIGKINEGL